MALGIGAANATQYCATLTGSNFKIVGVTWGNSSHLVSAGPGQQDVPLTVTFQSFGNSCSLEDVQGTLQLYGGVTNFNGSSISQYYMQSISPYQMFSMVFNLNIAQNVSASPNKTITYPLYLSWNYTNETSRNTQEFSLSVPMEGSSQLLFGVNNHGLVSGEQNNVTLQVTNVGSGYAYYISPSIYSTSLSLTNQPVPIASLAPGETKDIILDMYVSPSLAGQPVQLTLNTHYIGPYKYNTTSSTTLNLYALPISQSAISISASSQDIIAGNLDNLDIIISNNGDAPISNLSIQLTPSSPLTLIGSDGFYVFPALYPGKNTTIPIQVYVGSSTSTVASIDTAITYSLYGQAQSSSRSLSFLTPGYINLTTLSTSLIPAVPNAGSIFSLTSTINNVGASAASAATVTPHLPHGISVVGENSTFIGSLPPSTPTAFTLSFMVAPDAIPGTYEIPVTLTYSNNLNQRVNQTFTYSVVVGGGSASTGNYANNSNTGNIAYGNNSTNSKANTQRSGGIILPIVLIVIIILAIYYLYKRRKDEEKGSRKVH